jgi:hypothetical protein
MNNTFSKIKTKRCPEIDEKNMLKFHHAPYSTQENVFFTENLANPHANKTLSGPRFVKITDLPLNKKIRQPLVDIEYHSPRIPFLSFEKIKQYYQIKLPHIFIVFIAHILIVLCYLMISYLVEEFHQMTPDIVEITFGLQESTPKGSFQPPDNKEGKTDQKTAATKTVEELPQLTKNIAPETSRQKMKKESLIESEKDIQNDLSTNEEIGKKTLPHKETASSKQEKNKVTNQNIDPNKQKIKIDDFLARKEIDSRKIDLKKRPGFHDIEEMHDSKKEIRQLPASPFANNIDEVPESPFAQIPSGNLEGKIISKIYNSYKAYVAHQLKINWKTSHGTTFPSYLKVKLKFTINANGALTTKPTLIVSSGNQKFDRLALRSLENTFPLSDRPPKEINPPQTFEASYSAKDVQ